MTDALFWKYKKVFITGHTGFKGSWLCIWLNAWGAEIHGYALDPPTRPSLYETAAVSSFIGTSTISDIRDRGSLEQALARCSPEIVFHLAAQPIVRDSYLCPLETYETNVMGTANLLDAARRVKSIKAVVIITTDKVYENREWHWGYRESEMLGGYDPYSSSKACSELVTASYRNSFFNVKDYGTAHHVAVASARAGNVIGGGDWAKDRLVPDCIRALMADQQILIRSPRSVRPWQHVLEPLLGYMVIARKLYDDGIAYAEAWNFGPDDADARPVEWIVKRLCEQWGAGAGYIIDSNPHPHEANYLKLDCSKAKALLAWKPRWDLNAALEKVTEWARAYRDNKDMHDLCLRQIDDYLKI
ncbi:MAG: CDP-glucose 4,6-dehydratase [Spirochaetes bacterium]|nr:CDP-glucose 4,6-dehydratase [Spirochaetota bacterium]